MHALLVCFITCALAAPLAIAAWTQAASYTGPASQTTNYFTIPTSEWRLSWTITPDPDYPTYAGFSVFIYPRGETALYVDSLYITGDTQKTGTLYVHEGNGEYYLKISSANLDGYTVKAEYEQAAATPTPTKTPTPAPGQTGTGINSGAIALVGIAALIIIALILRARSKKKLTETPPPPPPISKA